jgi:hypothetical protein
MRKAVLIIFLLLSSANSNAQQIFPFSEEGKWYFVDSTLHKVSNRSFSFIEPFNGQFAVISQGGKQGIVNKKIKFVVKPKYDQVSVDYSNSQFVALDKKKKTFEYFDLTGKRIEGTPSRYGCGTTGNILSGYFYIYNVGKRFGVNIYSKGVAYSFEGGPDLDSIPGLFDGYMDCHDAIFLKIDNKWGAYDFKGVKKLDFSFDEIRPECSQDYLSYAFVKIDSLYGLVDNKLNLITPTKYLEIAQLRYGFHLVKTITGQQGYIDQKGKEYFK